MRCRLAAPAALILCMIAWGAQAEPAKPTTLQRYLAAAGHEKNEIRKELLESSAAELRAAITSARPAAPEGSGVLERETKCPDGFTRPYWLYVPEKYDAAKDYPLVVCLHGSCAAHPLRGSNGGKPAALWALGYWIENLPDAWKGKVALLGCSAGVPETNDDAVWYFKGGEANVLHMIAQAKRTLSIDDNAVFVSGHSDGGNGSFGFAFRRPEAFAGYLPMCGNFTVPMLDETPIWWENLKGQSIYAFNGAADDLYPAGELTPFYDIANGLGANIEYRVHETLTHDISPVVAEEVKGSLDKRVAKWRRNLKPATIDWTCTDPARGRRAWLSIDAIADLGDFNKAPENAPLFGNRVRLGVQLSEAEAPTVASVTAGGAAEAAGLKAGDVFLKLDGTSIETVDDLAAALARKQAGDKFTVTVLRGAKDIELSGEFAAAEIGRWQSPDKARVIGTWKPGEVTLEVSNAATISIYVFDEMLGKDAKLNVKVNGKLIELGKLEPDIAFMLDEFERTADRSLPWLRRVTIDVAKLAK